MQPRWHVGALLVALLAGSCLAESVEDIRKKCKSAEGLRSCSDCSKQHLECVWCTDHLLRAPRCDHKSIFETTCPSAIGSSTGSSLTVPEQHNLPLDAEQPHYKKPIQLVPQLVYMRIKPGDTLRAEFTYKHAQPTVEVQNLQIQTSDLSASGVKIEFEIDCHGQTVVGRSCEGISPGDIVKFYANVTVEECHGKGDTSTSIGVYGYTMIAAIYITPLCTCECEKPQNHRLRDPHCRGKGSLICGQCECDPGVGGRLCECDLAQHGVSSATELDDKCRSVPGEAVCSGRGICECGKCKCFANFVKGAFCECDATSCPKDADGRLCSGRGVCECGKCQCEEGFSGEECACRSDPAACRENGQICSNHGKCECGQCSCNDGFTGAFCSVEQSSDAKDGKTLNEAEVPEIPDGAVLPEVNSAESQSQQGQEPSPGPTDSSNSGTESFGIAVAVLAFAATPIIMRRVL